MPYVSQLAFYDIGLSDRLPKTETPQDSQRLLYEGHNPQSLSAIPLLPRTEETITHSDYPSPVSSVATTLTSSFIQLDPIIQAMQSIVKCSGKGGAIRQAFIREVRAVYHCMLRSPLEHQLIGYGEWEFVTQLGEVLRGEAKDVLAAFLDEWDFENEENANIEAAGFGYEVEPIKP